MHSTPKRMDKLITIKEAAARLASSTRDVYRKIARGDLPKPIKDGRSSKFFESDISDYIENLKKQRG